MWLNVLCHTHMNELCHSMRCVTHTWMSCVTWCVVWLNIAAMQCLNDSCRTHMNESCHAHMNKSCRTNIDDSCHTHMTELCHTRFDGSCHTHINESCHSYMNEVTHLIHVSVILTHVFYPPKNWSTLAVHERVDSRFLVLPGSESTITEITEYIYFSPSKLRREFKYKSEKNSVPVDLIIETILFFVKHNIYILLHACSAIVRLLHSWADTDESSHTRFLQKCVTWLIHMCVTWLICMWVSLTQRGDTASLTHVWVAYRWVKSHTYEWVISHTFE